MHFSQSARSSIPRGSPKPERPAVWPMTWRTSMLSLPFSANSGQYVATDAEKSSSPRSASIKAQRNVIVLVVDQTFTIVSLSQGSDFAESR